MAESEVARFREEHTLREEAVRRVVRGLVSGSSRHAFIIARMDRGAAHILRLLEEGKYEEAQALMETRTWGQEEPPEEGNGSDVTL